MPSVGLGIRLPCLPLPVPMLAIWGLEDRSVPPNVTTASAPPCHPGAWGSILLSHYSQHLHIQLENLMTALPCLPLSILMHVIQVPGDWSVLPTTTTGPDVRSTPLATTTHMHLPGVHGHGSYQHHWHENPPAWSSHLPLWPTTRMHAAQGPKDWP